MKDMRPPVFKHSVPASNATELMPGDVAVGFAGDQLKTLLGSCVSVILTDPRRTVGAMCHIVHAGLPSAAESGNTAYAKVAMEDMCARLTRIGVSPTQCLAYVYGGGNMFPDLIVKRHIGENNVDWVLDYLHTRGINIVDYDVGGNGYRKIRWTVGPAEPEVETIFPDES